ncbi:MAG: hypothetical protein ACO289_08605 [Prochlorococcaceae cyanobacterium]
MARPEQLQPGQVNPAAKPVDAFIDPIKNQVAQPAQPDLIGQPRMSQVVREGGTTYVQGSNSFKELADRLSVFQQQAAPAMQAAGLAYADWRMTLGEAEAMEAQQKALVRVDEATEVGQLERAAQSRAIAAKDPQAGALMNFLDPYKQIGYERGQTKLAALELTMGMGGYVAQRGGEIDYMAEDQGFGQLQRIRADYINQVREKYGVDSGSPGFQKYFLPAVTRASESVANAIAEDRVKFLDRQVPAQTAAQVALTVKNAMKDGAIEYGGNVYSRASSPDQFKAALVLRLAQVMQQSALSSGLPGGATKRYEEVYKALQADVIFYGREDMREIIDAIPTNTPVIGPDGKAIVNPETSRPVMFTLGQLYAQESIDSRLRYGKAGADERARIATEGMGSFRDQLARKLANIPPGPQQAAVASQFMYEFYGSKQNTQGARIGLDELQKIVTDVTGNSNKLLYLGSNEAAIPEFYLQLQAMKGSNFDVKAARAMQQQTAGQILDPTQRAQFLLRSDSEIKKAEEAEAATKAFRSPRDKAINRQIEIDLAREYPVIHAGNRQDVDAGKAKAYQRYLAVSDAAIQEWRAKYGADPTDAQVEEIVKGAVFKLRKETNEIDRGLYPGGKSGGPSMRPVPKTPDGANAPAPKLYEVSQLDAIPNRKVVLRQYTSLPVLSLPALRGLVDDAAAGKTLPVKVERAWRDAGARSAWDFIEQQMRRYPNYNPGTDFSPQELQKAKKRLVSMASVVDSMFAAATLSEQMPALASIASWHNALTFG